MKQINIQAVVNTYKSVSAIKRNQETIMLDYAIEANKDFVEYILKPAKGIINGIISANYEGAIDKVNNGELALLDAIKRAKSDAKFKKEASNIGLSLQDATDLIKLYFSAVSIDGIALKKVNEYKVDEDGNYILTEDGKRIITSSWYEYKEITASNASAIVTACLKRMRYEAIHEISHVEGWNVKKVGK